MGVTRERFNQGITYQQFKDAMKVNRERLEANEHGLNLSDEELKPFRDLPRPINVVALAADWCADVVANLPILGRLAEDSGKLNVRVFERDENLDIMNQYLKQGRFQSIPTFVFFDDDFNELGVWIERPESVTDTRDQKRRDVYTQHPHWGSPDASINDLSEEVRQEVRQATNQMRENTKAWADGEVVRELRELVERIHSKAVA